MQSNPKQLYFSFMEPEEMRIKDVRISSGHSRYTQAPTLADIFRDFGLIDPADEVAEAILSQNRLLEDLPWKVR